MTSARQIYLVSRRGPALPYDAEVEYIESAGTQWIDTGVRSLNAIDYELVFALVSPVTGAGIFGALVQDTENTANRIVAIQRQRIISVQRGDFSTVRNVRLDYNWHTIFSSAQMIAIDNTQFSGQSCSDSSATMAICGSGGAGGAVALSSLRVSHVRMRNSGDVVRDMIPVRYTNDQGQSEVAMYDRVSGQLFRNAGTGVFGFGTDIAGGGYKWLGYSPWRFSRFSRLWKEAA